MLFLCEGEIRWQMLGAHPLDFARMVLGTYSTSSDDIEHRILTRAPRLGPSIARERKTRRKIFPPNGGWKAEGNGNPPGYFQENPLVRLILYIIQIKKREGWWNMFF